MALVIVRPPAEEPVSLAAAKAHLRIEDSAEDALVQSLITTSRLHIEAALGLALVSQDWVLRLDAWPPGGCVSLPLRPLIGVTTVRIADGGGALVIPSGDYVVDTASAPPRLVPKSLGWPLPSEPIDGIEIEFSAGYGPTGDDVPAPVRQAMLMLVAHWYEHREPALAGAPVTRIPDTVSALLAPYRMARL